MMELGDMPRGCTAVKNRTIITSNKTKVICKVLFTIIKKHNINDHNSLQNTQRIYNLTSKSGDDNANFLFQ